MFTTTHAIDWLSYTIPLAPGDDMLMQTAKGREVLASYLSGYAGPWKEAKARHGYYFALQPKEGAGPFVMLGGHDERMGVHVQFSGSALVGRDAMALIAAAIEEGGHIGRLDLALDCHSPFDFKAFSEALKGGSVIRQSRKHSSIDSSSGKTVYVGSRSSERYLRVYDKAAESQLDKPLTRIELECKGDNAHVTAGYLLEHGCKAIPSIIAAFCDWPGNEWWAHAMSSLPYPALPKVEKRTDRLRWYNEVVGRAILDDLRQGTPGVLAWLLELIRTADANTEGTINEILAAWATTE